MIWGFVIVFGGAILLASVIGAFQVNDDAGWDRTLFEKLCLVYLWVWGIAAVLAVLIGLSILIGFTFFGGSAPIPLTGTQP